MQGVDVFPVLHSDKQRIERGRYWPGLSVPLRIGEALRGFEAVARESRVERLDCHIGKIVAPPGRMCEPPKREQGSAPRNLEFECFAGELGVRSARSLNRVHDFATDDLAHRACTANAFGCIDRHDHPEPKCRAPGPTLTASQIQDRQIAAVKLRLVT